MKFSSLFSGIGGFDLGLERAGMTCAWQIENDPHCLGVLARHWPDIRRHSDDIAKVSTDDLERVDFVCGGFPCQDVSVAGNRAGLGGARSGLWLHFARVLHDLRPAWVVVENVPGLLSSNAGRDMGTVLGRLGELGYGWAYRVLDAQHFGLAQRRRRVFIVASLGDRAGPAEVLFEPDCGGRDFAPGRASGQATSALTANGVGAGGGPDDNAAQAGHLIAVNARQDPVHDPNTVGALDTDGTSQAVAFSEAQITHPENRANPQPGDPAPTLNRDDAARIDVAYQCHGTSVGEMGTLKGTGLGSGVPFVTEQTVVRRLMPVECERLQGFPDNWTADQSDTQRYRQLGNAVAVPCAEWTGQRILKAAA